MLFISMHEKINIISSAHRTRSVTVLIVPILELLY